MTSRLWHSADTPSSTPHPKPLCAATPGCMFRMSGMVKRAGWGTWVLSLSPLAGPWTGGAA